MSDWYVYVRESWQDSYQCHVVSDTKDYALKCARAMRRKCRSVVVSGDDAYETRGTSFGLGTVVVRNWK